MEQQAEEVSELQDNKLRYIYQFLVERNLQTTAETLILEATGKKSKSIHNGPCRNPKIFSSLHEELCRSFENGDGKKFFALWQNTISEGIKRTKEYKLLTLNLYVYFAVLPIRKRFLYKHEDTDERIVNGSESGYKTIEKFMTDIEKSRNEGMEQLREFLDKFGKELECEGPVRPFFALPFIEDPQAEPSLSQIFDRKWSDELIEAMHIFLNKYKECFMENLDEGVGNISTQGAYGSNTENQLTVNNNLPIIPNDRNIPIFLDNHEVDEQAVTESLRRNQSLKNIAANASRTYSSGDSLDNIQSPTRLQNQKSLVQYSQELALTKSHLCTVHSKYDKLKMSFYKLHGDYQKLQSVAGELTLALENSVKGEKIDLQTTLETCINIFPDLFNENVKDESQQMLNESVTPVSPKLLDFRKVKMHLVNGTIKIRLFLLQALRQKITLSSPDERDEAIHEYISKDLLGLHTPISNDNGRSILACLLAPGNIIMPHPLQQSAARLLNTLSSVRCGRDYLSSGYTVVSVILQCLSTTSNNEIDAFTCNMLISTLQKLSIRKHQRIYMIENGLVEWLIHHLQNECHVMGPYRLDNATALLMNLSLHRVAQKRASIMATLLISTLLTVLSMDHASALPYITGSLKNFLSNRIINDEAKKMKLSPILEHYRNHKTGEIRSHLDHILRKHRGEITISVQDETDTDDGNEEFDVIEDELEYNDPVKHYPGELSGESLLATCYLMHPRHIQEKNAKQNFSASRYFKINPSVRYSIEQSSDPQSYDHVAYNKSSILSESSKMTAAASSGNFTAVCESRPADIGRLSSIASLTINNCDNYSDDTSINQTTELTAEEAFLAKPKLSRTPP